ncbi:MAG: Uma2 family endonuclease [Nocardioides sp.]
MTGPALPFTRDDLDSMPDDGYRYEIIDGALIVTPAPSWDHQRAQGRLMVMLANLCPPDLEVLSAPFDVALAEDTVIEPDIVVARTADYARRGLATAPVLAVEVLSPSTPDWRAAKDGRGCGALGAWPGTGMRGTHTTKTRRRLSHDGWRSYAVSSRRSSRGRPATT